MKFAVICLLGSKDSSQFVILNDLQPFQITQMEPSYSLAAMQIQGAILLVVTQFGCGYRAGAL